ncbi:MAG: hypothetical protein LUC87_02810 [Clostridiales bacterium]|nr:hypothetical protein [Clostridiales bacterium]MCD8367351.1 hypothetical protein [Clostridiales bacterium]
MDIYENNKLCSIGYELSFAKEFRLDTRDVPEPLSVSTAKYAVQRYLKRNDKLLRRLVPASYEMRLSSGKGRAKRLVCVVSAGNMELPGNWAELKLLVDAKGITVQKLRITLEYPDQRARRKYKAPTISSWTPEDDLKGTA